MIVWEAIDLWEWWRGNNKTFFSGGRAPDLMMVSPHHSAAEWERGERLQELEQALALLALPGIDSWDALDPIGQGPYGIYEWCRAHVDEQSYVPRTRLGATTITNFSTTSQARTFSASSS
jgi:hypothetical protein